MHSECIQNGNSFKFKSTSNGSFRSSFIRDTNIDKNKGF